MVPIPEETFHLRLEVGREEVPVESVEITGQWAAVRGARSLRPQDDVRLHIEWAQGGRTTLAGRVHSVAPLSPTEQLAQVELAGVEGDWSAFLAFLGPLLIGGAAA